MTTPKTATGQRHDRHRQPRCDIALEKALSRTSTLPTAWSASTARPASANPFRPPGSPIAAAPTTSSQKRLDRKHTLKSILGEMGIKPAGTIPEMADQIAEELAASGRPLIIDEMDHLVAAGQVELIRDLYESSQASILLIGEEMLPTSSRSTNAVARSQLGFRAASVPEDARNLAPVAQVAIADDLLAHLVKKSWALSVASR
ncbi:AAA family ATPase [Pseudomonas aeruginosa]|uniref:AAA family ATPase n=1 Tax=Pseudomonas aeruginosa TaxID=287 RepID=UPI003D6E2857